MTGGDRPAEVGGDHFPFTGSARPENSKQAPRAQDARTFIGFGEHCAQSGLQYSRCTRKLTSMMAVRSSPCVLASIKIALVVPVSGLGQQISVLIPKLCLGCQHLACVFGVWRNDIS